MHLKNLYGSPDTMGNILNTPIEEDIFFLEEMEFKTKKLANGKARDIEGY